MFKKVIILGLSIGGEKSRGHEENNTCKRLWGSFSCSDGYRKADAF